MSETPDTVTTTLTYFSHPKDGEKPRFYARPDSKTGEHTQNWVNVDHQHEVENIRGKEDQYTLDSAGFQWFQRESKHKGFTNDADIQRQYYPEVIELIKELTGATDVVIFDHTVRHRDPAAKGDNADNRQPVARVHVDQSPKAAVNRVHRHLPPERAPALVKGRFRIINLWRPINNPADDWPLALCDYRSTDPKDYVPTTLSYPDYEGETLSVSYNPEHKWKYLRGMRPDEFVLIKCFDSKEGVAVFTPHTGFEDPTTPPDAPPRESIEVRTLAFYE